MTRPRTGELLRVDPDLPRVDPDRQTSLRIELGGRPGAIVVAGGRVWVADEAGGGVSAVNPPVGRVFKRGTRSPRGAAAPRASAPAGSGSAAPRPGRSAASTSATRSAVLRSQSAAAPPASPSAVASSGSPTAAATRSPASTPRPVSSSVSRSPSATVPGESTPAPTPSGSPTTTMTPSPVSTSASGESVGDAIGVGPAPGAVAVGEEAVWVANNGDGTVTRIEP